MNHRWTPLCNENIMQHVGWCILFTKCSMPKSRKLLMFLVFYYFPENIRIASLSTLRNKLTGHGFEVKTLCFCVASDHQTKSVFKLRIRQNCFWLVFVATESGFIEQSGVRLRQFDDLIVRSNNRKCHFQYFSNIHYKGISVSAGSTAYQRTILDVTLKSCSRCY